MFFWLFLLLFSESSYGGSTKLELCVKRSTQECPLNQTVQIFDTPTLQGHPRGWVTVNIRSLWNNSAFGRFRKISENFRKFRNSKSCHVLWLRTELYRDVIFGRVGSEAEMKKLWSVRTEDSCYKKITWWQCVWWLWTSWGGNKCSNRTAQAPQRAR